MRYTEDVGIQASTGDTRKPEKIECMYVAGAAITVGKQVEISTLTDYPYGCAVITGATATDHAACGIYEGQSESRGAATTVTGLAGYDALIGETIFVTVHGPAVALCYATATDTTMAALDAISFAGAAGRGANVAAPAAGLIAVAIALEAQTASATGGAATDIFVRFM